MSPVAAQMGWVSHSVSIDFTQIKRALWSGAARFPSTSPQELVSWGLSLGLLSHLTLWYPHVIKRQQALCLSVASDAAITPGSKLEKRQAKSHWILGFYPYCFCA